MSRSAAAWAVLALVVVALQALLIGRLLAVRARLRRAHERYEATEADLRAGYERTRRLAGRLINAREAMRARIARDLHDDVCQQLATLSLGIAELRQRRWDIQAGPAQAALAALQGRTVVLVENIRRLSHDLHPSTLQHIGIPAQLDALCIEIERRYDVQVTLICDGDLRTISSTAALSLFRIAQEALRNAAVHGNARRVTVTMARSADAVELTVTDDGQGFDAVAPHARGSLGLCSMEERAYLMGGRFEITSQPGTGTTVHVRIPWNVTSESEATVEDYA